MIHKLLYRLGTRLRNPSLSKLYRGLKETETWTQDELEALQWNRLEALLRFAGRHSPYYRSVLSRLDWAAQQPLTEKTFERIPVVEKKDLIANNDAIHAQHYFGSTFLCETSGTSGEILTFRRDERWDSFNRAAAMRGYSWHAVHPWEFNIYFWGYNIDPEQERRVRLKDSLVNRYRFFDYGDQAVESFADKVERARYIEGYSSMIYEFACRVRGRDLDFSKLKMVKGTSEKIFPHYVSTVEEVFGQPLISEYGAAESGIIAFECPEGSMHVNEEGVYLETDADGGVIVTNLMSRSFPVIRYRLGDRIKRAPDEFRCPCGMEHQVIEEVTGRIGKSIVGKTREFPSLTLYYIFKNLFFNHHIQLNYQGRQSECGKLEIAIRESPGSEVRARLEEECEKYFGDELDVSLDFGAELRSENGKLRDFVSKL